MSGSQQPVLLAIDFGGTKLDVAIAALDGTITASVRLDTVAADGAGQVVDRAVEAAHALASDARIVAVGAASPGIVLDDRVLLAPNVPGWTELALAARLRDGLGVDAVVTVTDVKAGALAEARWGALRDADPGVFLSLGTGLAAGLVVGGRVLAGANGAAGEIGYALRGTGDDAGAADGRAPLEEHVGGRALGERGSRLLGDDVSAADLLARAEHDERARTLVDGALDELAVHVANLAVTLDPQRIAVGGGLMRAAPLVLAALRRRVTMAAPFPPEIVPARFTQDAPLRGAIALAADAAAAAGHPTTTEEEFAR